ncbi:MAG TPA: rhodanese-like domain-containing protein [bacterium]|jgi:rhodanese-related sulfurtransferase|nr:rhodanese-like domain-containing protein [bacterium]
MAITKEEILEKMKNPETVLLDVLPQTDYEMLNIKGSFSLPLVGIRPEKFVQEVEAKYGKNKFFITYCSGFPCRHFQEAAAALTQAGFKCEGYPGGIQEWAEAGLPVAGRQAGN